MEVELRIEEARLFIEQWAKLIDRWGDDIAQEAAVRALAGLKPGNRKPPHRYLLVIAKRLSRQRYSDLTFDKVSDNHPDFIKGWAGLPDDEFISLWNELYSVSEKELDVRQTLPAPSRIDPLRRALEANLREWRDASRTTEDEDRAAQERA